VNTGDSAPEKVREAAAGFDRATALWDATDTGRIEDCRQALEQVTATMSEARAILLANGDAPPEIRAQMTAIRAGTLRLERLVDAASALVRTASPATTECAPVYDCAGTIASESLSTNPGVEA